MSTAPIDILRDGFGRVNEVVPGVVAGLTTAELLWRADRDANSIAWLLWHLGRVQDAQVADLAGLPDVWRSAGWYERLELPYPAHASGYGHTSAEVGQFRLRDPQLLTGYWDAVHEMTLRVLATERDLERIVDTNWDPPVTAAVRWVSILNDVTQHVGQASFVRGLVLRRR